MSKYKTTRHLNPAARKRKLPVDCLQVRDSESQIPQPKHDYIL